MQEAHAAVAGRVPLLAGLIVNSTREAIERVRLLAGLNIAALQVTPVHYLFKPDAEATVAHFRDHPRSRGPADPDLQRHSLELSRVPI